MIRPFWSSTRSPQRLSTQRIRRSYNRRCKRLKREEIWHGHGGQEITVTPMTGLKLLIARVLVTEWAWKALAACLELVASELRDCISAFYASISQTWLLFRSLQTFGFRKKFALVYHIQVRTAQHCLRELTDIAALQSLIMRQVSLSESISHKDKSEDSTLMTGSQIYR